MHPQFIECSITFVLGAMLLAHMLARPDRGASSRPVITLMAGLMLWSGAVALSRVAPDPERVFEYSRIGMYGAFLVPPAWIWLAATFNRQSLVEQAGRRVLLLFVPSLVMWVASATNGHHGLIIAKPEEFVGGTALEWAGPVFWFWVAWAYLLVVVGSGLYVVGSTRFHAVGARGRGLILMLAALLPLVASVIHIFGLISADYDRTPLLLGLSTLILYAADWRFRLLDAVPIARRDVIDVLEDAVIVADANGRIVHMNPAAERMGETRLSEVSGQPLVRVVATQLKGRMQYDEAKLLRIVDAMCSKPTRFKSKVEGADGRIHEVRGASVGDSGTGVSGLYMILQDRTDAIRFEAMSRQSRRSRALASLAGGIAHEINNPLAYVRANVTHLVENFSKGTGMGGDDAVTADDVACVLEETLEGVNRISGIVERVLRLSSTEASTQRAIDVNLVVEDALRISGLDAHPTPVLLLDLMSDLPQVHGPEDQLLQCLVEVLENAVRAVDCNRGHVSVRTFESNGVVMVAIADDGPGVAPELRERVFDPFFTAEGEAEGSGLGLPTAAKAVVEFGGVIDLVESTMGGAEVIIRLPV